MATSRAFATMCSECPDGLFIHVCEVKATRFQPSTKVNYRIQVATDRQRSVADRRHRGGEAFKIASRTPRIHVMGLRQKFGNVHVNLSWPPELAAIRETTLCGRFLQHSVL